MQNKFKTYCKYTFTAGSTCLSFALFFYACGRPFTQEIKVFVNKPNISNAKFAHSVNVAISLNGFGGTLYTQELLQGENNLILPKGKINVITAYLATTKQYDNSQHFVYSKFNQEVLIDKNTNSLEIYYPELSTVQYRKFAFLFNEKTKTGKSPVIVESIRIQDPIANRFIKNPKTGEALGFKTNELGIASVDIPVFGMQKEINLFIQKTDNDDGKIMTIPLNTTHSGIEFYEITLNNSNSLRALDLSSENYLDSTKNIQKQIESGQNPRFKNVISSSDYKLYLTNQMKSDDKINFLKPLRNRNADVKSKNIYSISGRNIIIKCKPHNGIMYIDCPNEITKQDLKILTNLKDADEIDFLITDQDGYSIYTDEKSKRDSPVVLSIKL